MYALVQDVAQYPSFLPWCAAGHVRAGDREGIVEARVDIAYLGVRSHFTTRNTGSFPDAIELDLVDGPFRDLHGSWTFLPLRDQGCKVTFELQYRFATGLLGRAVAPVFEGLANSLVDAFAERAQVLYGAVDG